eukprot:7363688-Pyramimonas_sp.AAC.1
MLSRKRAACDGYSELCGQTVWSNLRSHRNPSRLVYYDPLVSFGNDVVLPVDCIYAREALRLHMNSAIRAYPSHQTTLR